MAHPRRVWPQWLLVGSCMAVQVGFAGYGVLIKKYAQGSKVDALVFSTVRCVVECT